MGSSTGFDGNLEIVSLSRPLDSGQRGRNTGGILKRARDLWQNNVNAFTSAASDSYVDMQTLPVRVTGRQAIAEASIWCGGTTGALTGSMFINWFGEDWRQSSLTASISVDGGGFATFTTTVPHGLVVNDVVMLMDSGGTVRRWRVSTVATATTFVVTTAGVTLPASATYQHVGPSRTRAFSSDTMFSDIASLYADTDFVGYTGNRAWWLKPYACHARQIPQGAAWATGRVLVSNLANADVVYLGSLALAQWS